LLGAGFLIAACLHLKRQIQGGFQLEEVEVLETETDTMVSVRLLAHRFREFHGFERFTQTPTSNRRLFKNYTMEWVCLTKR
jgi:hypothetical protein